MSYHELDDQVTEETYVYHHGQCLRVNKQNHYYDNTAMAMARFDVKCLYARNGMTKPAIAALLSTAPN
jgi:hypothetical protein